MDRSKLQQAIVENPHFTSTRKVSLYSNFARLENLNPTGYTANIEAWKEVLNTAVKLHAFPDKTCIQSGPELAAKLSDPKNGTPLSISRVLDTMLESGELIPVEQFRSRYPIGQPSSVVLRALSWSLNWFTGSNLKSSQEDQLKLEKYVDLEAVKTQAKDLIKVLETQSSKRGNSYSSQIFVIEDISPQDWSKLDVELCVGWLKSENQLFVGSNGIVKLRNAGEISEIDLNIVQIRQHTAVLAAREHALALQVTQYDTQAREAIKTNRSAAKLLLQKKQAAEKSQSRVLNTLDQLETVLQKIDDASDNRQAFATLSTVPEILEAVNMDVEDVDGLVDRVKDGLAVTDEVTQSLAELSIDEVREMEVDDELEQMLREEKASEAKIDLEMPAAPRNKPVDVQTGEKKSKQKQLA